MFIVIIDKLITTDTPVTKEIPESLDCCAML
jgi:hypothetical protein